MGSRLEKARGAMCSLITLRLRSPDAGDGPPLEAGGTEGGTASLSGGGGRGTQRQHGEGKGGDGTRRASVTPLEARKGHCVSMFALHVCSGAV